MSFEAVDETVDCLKAQMDAVFQTILKFIDSKVNRILKLSPDQEAHYIKLQLVAFNKIMEAIVEHLTNAYAAEMRSVYGEETITRETYELMTLGRVDFFPDPDVPEDCE